MAHANVFHKSNKVVVFANHFVAFIPSDESIINAVFSSLTYTRCSIKKTLEDGITIASIADSAKRFSLKARHIVSHPKYTRKFTAIFLLFIHLFSLLSPLSTFATNAPAQQEFASFEPANASDMVDLNTGDFGYNLPLLSVPGPEGDYPLNLFYHGGIAMEQEASWVGLGWNINVGALGRAVVGAPDDWVQKKSGVLVSHYERNQGSTPFFGNSRKTDFTQVDFSSDKLSSNVKTYFKFGLLVKQVGKMGSFGSQIDYGHFIDPRSFAKDPTRDFINNYISVYRGSNPVNHLYLKNIYFLDRSESYSTGSLYPSLACKTINGWSEQDDDYSGDVYENEQASTYNGDPFYTTNNTALAAFDNYRFFGQGFSGSISPVYTKTGLLIGSGRSKGEGANNVQNDYFASTQDENKIFTNIDKIFFTVENELSSYLAANPVTFGWSNPVNPLDDVSYNGAGVSFQNANGESFYNPANKRLGKSTHVEWYSNKQIIDAAGNLPGFIEYSQDMRMNDAIKYGGDEGIGAYTITNQEGISYHYSLPVYQLEFFNASRAKNNIDSTSFIIRKNAPYAMTWLLTAITGADYVDKNGNKQVDEQDYGYWVKFDYGKWADGYPIRTPFIGYDSDDQGFKTFQMGFKQVYYLDRVKTRTHSALFVKSVREDAKSPFFNTSDNILFNSGDRVVTPKMAEQIRKLFHGNMYCAHDPDPVKKIFDKESPLSLGSIKDYVYITAYGQLPNLFSSTFTSNISSVRALKLDKILVVKNESIITQSISNPNLLVNNTFIENYTYFSPNPCTCVGYVNGTPQYCNSTLTPQQAGSPTFKSEVLTSYYSEFFNNIIDASDVIPSQDIINSVNFEYDAAYPLCKGIPSSSNGKGKLTLSKVVFKGIDDKQTLPSYDFRYGSGAKNPDYDIDKADTWGFYSPESASNENPDYTCQKSHADAWSLTKITTPTGYEINVTSESDEYIAEAVFNGFREDTVDLEYIIGEQGSDFNTNVIRFKSHSDVSCLSSISNLTLTMDSFRFYSPPCPNLILQGPGLSFISFLHMLSPTLPSFPLPQSNAPKVGLIHGNLTYNPIDNTVRFQNLTNSNFFPNNNVYTNLAPNASCNNSAQYVLAGFKSHVKIPNFTTAKGGGVRVKEISVKDPISGDTYYTTFDYKNPNTNQVSGKTSYRPTKSDRFVPFLIEIPSPGVVYEYVTVTSKGRNGDYLGKTQYHFEGYTNSPDPNAIDFKLPGLLEVENLQTGYNNTGWVWSSSNNSNTGNKLYIRSSIIHNKTNKLGRLLDVKLFNKQGDLLSKTTKEYFDENTFPQGHISQTFLTRQRNSWGNSLANWWHKSTTKHDYPVVTKKEITESNGVTITNENVKFDFKSGQLLVSKSYNSYGDEVLTKVIPAFHIYNDEPGNALGISAGKGMGSKIINSSNKNMLTQVAANYNYLKKSGESEIRPIGASIQTWNDKWSYREFDENTQSYTNTVPANSDPKYSIWRKHQSWTWKGDINSDGALLNYASLNANTLVSSSDFNFERAYYSLSQVVPGWKNISENTLFDHYSKLLEVKDINGNYSSSKIGYKNTLPLASATNSNYYSFAASSFEDYSDDYFYFGGEVRGALSNYFYTSTGDNIPSDNDAGENLSKVHTGYYSLKLDNGNEVSVFSTIGEAFTNRGGFKTGKKYTASVWMNRSEGGVGEIRADFLNGTSSSVVINSSYTPVIKNGNWGLYSVNFDVPINTAGIEIKLSAQNGVVYFDDFRFHAVDAGVTSFVYDNWNRLSHALDENNMYTKYVYDSGGRLLETWKETKRGEKLLSRTKYNYARL